MIDAITGHKVFHMPSVQASPSPTPHFSKLRAPTIDLDGPTMQSEEMKAYSKPYLYREAQILLSAVNAWGISDDELKIYRKAKLAQTFDIDSPPTWPGEMTTYGEPFRFNEPNGHSKTARTPRSALDDMLAEHHRRHRMREAKVRAAVDAGPDQPPPRSRMLKARLLAKSPSLGSYEPIINVHGPPMAPDERHYYSQMFSYNEPDGQLVGAKQASQEPYDDLYLYRAQTTRPLFDNDSPPMSGEEIEHYKQPFHHNEPDGKQVEESSTVEEKEMEAELDLYRKSASNVSCTQSNEQRNSKPNVDTLKRFATRFQAFRASRMDEGDVLDCLRASDIRDFSSIGIPSKTQSQPRKDNAVKWQNNNAEVSSQRIDDNCLVHHQNASVEMTGDFARDFLEEVTTSWNEELASDTSRLRGTKDSITTVEVFEQPRLRRQMVDRCNKTGNVVGCQPSENTSSTRLQTALDRHYAEHAFSSDKHESADQKASRTKRILVGATWFAGCCYVVGFFSDTMANSHIAGTVS